MVYSFLIPLCLEESDQHYHVSNNNHALKYLIGHSHGLPYENMFARLLDTLLLMKLVQNNSERLIEFLFWYEKYSVFFLQLNISVYCTHYVNQMTTVC